MSRPVRPFDTKARQDLAEWLETLATELRAPHAGTVQQQLGDTATAKGYPNRSSGVHTTPHHPVDEHGRPVQPDTPTEQAALNGDPQADQAARILDQLVILRRASKEALNGLRAWSPNRRLETCPVCHAPKTGGRCQATDPTTGVQCAANKNTRLCRDCGDVCAPGQYRGGRCNACDIAWRRGTGKTRQRWFNTDGLDLGDGLIVVDTEGAVTTQHPADLEQIT